MTEREAIENLKGCVVGYEVDEHGRPNGNVTADLTMEIINLAISALEKQETDRWIPVTERLPEKDGDYLVTLYDSMERWTEVLYWNPTFGGRWQGLIEDDLSDIENVSAWRPLPAPYQEEKV